MSEEEKLVEKKEPEYKKIYVRLDKDLADILELRHMKPSETICVGLRKYLSELGYIVVEKDNP